MAPLMKWLLRIFVVVNVVSGEATTNRVVPCFIHRNCSCEEYPLLQVVDVSCKLYITDNLSVGEGVLPMTTNSFTVTGGSSVELSSLAFANRDHIRRVVITGAHTVRFMPGTYDPGETNNRLHIEIHDGQTLEIGSFAFNSFKTSVTMEISNFLTASIGESAFTTLNGFYIRDVMHLSLSQSSFQNSGRPKVQYHHGPALTVTLEGVGVREVPRNAFSTSFAMVRFDKVRIGAIRSSAFTGMQFSGLVFYECEIDSIHKDAFASKSHIMNMEIRRSKVGFMAGGAISSGVSSLAFINSTFHKISSGAIKINSASLRIDTNVFGTIDRNGIEVRGWNSLDIVQNKFGYMGNEAITTEPLDDNYSFNFIDNKITNAQKESLQFIGKLENGEFENNYFDVICNCKLSDWVRQIFGTYNEKYFEMSYCTVDEHVKKCFNFTDTSTMKKFTSKTCNGQIGICVPAKSVWVEQPSQLWKSAKKFICSTSGVIVLISVVLIFALFFFFFCRSYRTRIKDGTNFFKSHFIGLLLCFTPRAEVATATQSDTSAFNYCAESRFNNLTHLGHDGIDMSSMPLLTLEKATQSLPEELTEELLENLKTKLDDPSTYEEARETINHLYKMIMVEESCNTNGDEEEHIYDLPVPPIAEYRVKGPKRATVSVGTRVPSLDKLQAVPAYERGGLCREYFEPLDLAAHIYAEICSHRLGSVPDVLPHHPAPRGPFLHALRRKTGARPLAPLASPDSCTLGSNASTASGSSMQHRPLPPKPPLDPGEGTSAALRK